MATKKMTRTATPVVAEQNQVRKYEPGDLIPCHSVFAGCLLFSGIKTKVIYEFTNMGDFRYVEYQDLLAALLQRKNDLFAPNIIIDDEELLQDIHWQDVAKIYENMYDAEDLHNLLNLPTPKFQDEFIKLPASIKKNVATLVSGMIADGEFDSMNKIHIIDEACGTDLAILLK